MEEQHLHEVPDIDSLPYEDLQALGDVIGTVSKGLAAGKIEEIQTESYHSLSLSSRAQDDRCCICMCEYEGEDRVKLLSCGHFHHASCITQWLVLNKTCPSCNSEVLL